MKSTRRVLTFAARNTAGNWMIGTVERTVEHAQDNLAGLDAILRADLRSQFENFHELEIRDYTTDDGVGLSPEEVEPIGHQE